MDEDDIRRWTKLSIRKGKNIPISNQTLEEISKAFAEYIPTG
jgi:hypothetical protein